ncbi:MAG: type II toxin-antitoxin system VapC family toxin [Sphingopyxis sp.]|nr:type II toxin-antitoxin system VapC family toxin [Sphingopyxis sp.]
MIVCDSSPLASILLGEPDAHNFLSILARSDRLLIGAPNKLEVSMVMGGRYGPDGIVELNLLIEANDIEVVSWTSELADAAAEAFLRFGKGRHPAKLNFGDCMAYALAKSLDAPLLYKGDDFARTDIRSAL